MSGEYVGHGRTGTFSASRNCVQILATWARALSCWNMRWWVSGSRHDISAFKLLSIKCCLFVVRSLCLPIPYPHRHYGALCSQRWHQQTTHPHCTIQKWRSHWRLLRRRSRPWWGHYAYIWASLRRFLTVWADVLPNYLKQSWRRLMIEELTLNDLSTALVDISVDSMLIVYSLNTWDICGIMLCGKMAHFRVAVYCPPAQGAPV